eukprot:1568503-Rhodomonas_salina.1
MAVSGVISPRTHPVPSVPEQSWRNPWARAGSGGAGVQVPGLQLQAPTARWSTQGNSKPLLADTMLRQGRRVRASVPGESVSEAAEASPGHVLEGASRRRGGRRVRVGARSRDRLSDTDMPSGSAVRLEVTALQATAGHRSNRGEPPPITADVSVTDDSESVAGRLRLRQSATAANRPGKETEFVTWIAGEPPCQSGPARSGDKSNQTAGARVRVVVQDMLDLAPVHASTLTLRSRNTRGLSFASSDPEPVALLGA